jgi:DNA polymerase III subunit epsilon
MRAQFPGLGEDASAGAEQWAQDMIRRGVAVILDTETTALDRIVIEIAVIDAATGETLLATLVQSLGEPIDSIASQKHGLSEIDLARCPFRGG